MMLRVTLLIGGLLAFGGSGSRLFAEGGACDAWQAGFAKVVITPQEPMWLSGYGGRDHAAEGKLHDLYAKAAALRDPAGKTAVFVSTDLIGVTRAMADRLTKHLSERHGLVRADVMLTSSHTHCGPALVQELSYMLAMDEEDWQQVREYQRWLDARLIEVVDAAMADVAPARLHAGIGRSTFAVNRRKPIGEGPTDHDVPVLRATSLDGKTLRGVVFGYACHNTTLSFYQWCGDYAGFATKDFEDRHPGAVALFWAGCGGDQNPLPRRKVELAEKYGRMLSQSVGRVVDGEMTQIRGRLRTAFRLVPLEFEHVPGRKEIEADLESPNRFVRARAGRLLARIDEDGKLRREYPCPVQVWRLGDAVTWVVLGGEVVVDYSLRLKKELGEDSTWVTGYANDVMAYVPSERILKEGGYEGGGAMLYYQMPSPWKSGVEQKLVDSVHALVRATRQAPEVLRR